MDRRRLFRTFSHFCSRFSLYPHFRYLPECPTHGNLLKVDWRMFSKVFRNLDDSLSHRNIQPHVDLGRDENFQMSEESSMFVFSAYESKKAHWVATILG